MKNPGPRITPARSAQRKEAAAMFDFESADFSVPIPENVPTTPRSNELPFKGWYAKFADEALAGKQPHLFLPTKYWSDVRGVDLAKAKPTPESYARTKVRDQFNAWKKAAGSKYDKLNLVVIPRTGKEEIKGIEEPGLSIWMTVDK